jgi:hypothetical protein
MGNDKATSQRISDLEKRVARLEETLGGKMPPDVCRCCGERGLRLHSAYCLDEKGNVEEQWQCSACGKIDTRVSRPR